MTLQTEISRLAQSVGEHPNDLDTKEQFEAWIRDAVDEIYLEDWNFNIGTAAATISAGATEINAGVDVQQITSIIRTDLNEHLKYVTWEWLLTSRLDPELPGSPSHWLITDIPSSSTSEEVIRVWPIPTANVPIIIRSKLLVPPFGEFDKIPVHSALLPAMREHVKASYYGDDPARQEQYQNRLSRYEQLIQRAKQKLNSRSTPRPGSRWTDLSGARIEPNFIVPDNIPIS